MLDRDSLVSNLYQRLPRSRWSENFEFLSPAAGPVERVAPLATSRTSGGTFWNGRMRWLRICREEVTSSAHPTVVPQSELGNKDYIRPVSMGFSLIWFNPNEHWQ